MKNDTNELKDKDNRDGFKPMGAEHRRKLLRKALAQFMMDEQQRLIRFIQSKSTVVAGDGWFMPHPLTLWFEIFLRQGAINDLGAADKFHFYDIADEILKMIEG